MVLDSFKPDSLPTTCDDLARELRELESQVADYERLLLHATDGGQRRTLERQRERAHNQARTVRERLRQLRSARYFDDADAVWNRTIQVA